MKCPTCLHDDEKQVELRPRVDVLECPRCEGTFDERGEYARASSPTTLRTRKHRMRKRVELALSVAELVRALPDVAAIAQAVAAELSPATLAKLKRRLTVEHEIATHNATMADARQALLELGVPAVVPDVGNTPAPGVLACDRCGEELGHQHAASCIYESAAVKRSQCVLWGGNAPAPAGQPPGAGSGGCQPPATSRAPEPGESPPRAQNAQGTDRLNGAAAAGRHGGA